MKTNYKIHLLIVVFLFMTFGLMSQKKTHFNIGIIPFEQKNLHPKIIEQGIYPRQIQTMVTQKIISIDQLKPLERVELNLIKKEKEIQKDENFIDGYIVAQSKQIGADYLLFGAIDEAELELSLYDVATKELVHRKKIPIHLNLVRPSVSKGTILFFFEIFQKSIQVVKISEGKKEAKKIVVTGGTKLNLPVKTTLDVFYLENEVIDAQVFEREVIVGEVKIKKQETVDFTTCKVKKGGEAIKNYIDSGKPLYCRINKMPSLIFEHRY